MKHIAPIIPITDELQCEGCAKLATTSDVEGIPLCEQCADVIPDRPTPEPKPAGESKHA